LAERDGLKRCIDNAIKAANRSGDDYLPESTVGRMIAALLIRCTEDGLAREVELNRIQLDMLAERDRLRAAAEIPAVARELITGHCLEMLLVCFPCTKPTDEQLAVIYSFADQIAVVTAQHLAMRAIDAEAERDRLRNLLQETYESYVRYMASTLTPELVVEAKKIIEKAEVAPRKEKTDAKIE
jgi:GAF domain-containing protein